ncbi:MAG: hypothetical protein HY695_17825 [Deltaproteobacteria bacterium]|nr:hypothetical protein [Deltaproteobacteria bacterium]
MNKVEQAENWRTGLVEVGPNAFAYIQPGGEAGISNAGLIVGQDKAFVVDALATTPMATEVLGRYRTLQDLERARAPKRQR